MASGGNKPPGRAPQHLTQSTQHLDTSNRLEAAYEKYRHPEPKLLAPTEGDELLLISRATAALITGGRQEAEALIIEEGLAPHLAHSIVEKALAELKEITTRSSEEQLAIARARYDKIFRDNANTDPSVALRAQQQLDKLNGVTDQVATSITESFEEELRRQGETQTPRTIEPE